MKLPFTLVALAAAAVSVGCGRSLEPRTSLIVVTIDTLRADHLGCYGYFRDTSPNFDHFAAEAVLFESVFAPAATTLPTHASLFTGVYPLEHGVVANVGAGGKPFAWKPGLRTAAQLAKEVGFTTAAFVSAAPLKRHAGLADGFDLYDQPVGAQRHAGQTLDRVTRWLERTRERPIFLWVHWYDPHRPLEPPPEYAIFEADAELERHLAERRVPPVGYMEANRYVTREDIDRYDGEIRYVDDRLGALLRALRESGLYENAVIVLTADHGEGLNQHDWPGHGGTHVEQLHIPLAIRFPDVQRNGIGRVPALVSTVDILPTALPSVEPLLAERFAAQASGRNALAPGFQPQPILSRRTVRRGRETAGPLWALTTPEWRLLYELHRPDQLFHRARDPFEVDDQAAARPDVVAALRHQSAAVIEAQRKIAVRLGTADPGQASPLDRELLRQLEALGYAED